MSKDVRVKGPTGRMIHPSALICSDDSLASQSAKDDCDINVIVKRNLVSGVLPVSAVLPTYGDFEGVSNYREALDIVRQADCAFMRMPAEVRSRFDNDAGKFLEFFNDPKNIAEAIKLGLAEEVKAAEPPAPEAKPKA